ncbi:MAG TPA: transcriptional regulator [Actinomycetota bacterium]
MATAKSRVISLRLKRGPAARLERLARLFRRSMGETAALLLEEKLKEEEFAFIEFRDSTVGRQACVQGSSLAVWEVVLVAADAGMDAATVARLLSWPIQKVQAALAYAAANPEEIAPIVDEVRATTLEHVRATIPWVQEVGR